MDSRHVIQYTLDKNSAHSSHERMESKSGRMEGLRLELNIQENEWLYKWYKWQLY
jgi:hypothetical protein